LRWLQSAFKLRHISMRVRLSRAMTDGSILPQRVEQGRAACYLLFAQLFREAPRLELLGAIVQHNLLTLAEQWGEGSDSLDRAEDPRWPRQAEAIAVEYARLFAVPGERGVHLYESAYCDTLSIDTSTTCSAYFGDQRPLVGLPGFIGGPSASALARAYAEAGFELDPTAHEMPDHLSIELEFIGRLLERGDADDAKVFFQEHLGRWAFRCLEDIQRNTGSGFYRVLADTLATFLRHEQEVLTAKA